MRLIDLLRRTSAHARQEDGFTMMVTLGVMLVTSLLLAAAFTAANGDINLSRTDLTQKQAYFAAVAGVQAYEHELQVNPNFWTTCKSLSATLPKEESSSYEVKLLAPTGQPKGTKCSTSNPFETVIESSGTQANTFRIEATGTTGKSKRSLVATFGVNGFLNYIYFTRYETADPQTYGGPSWCKNYRPARKELEAKYKKTCTTIQFTGGDNVNGPLHTDDAALVCGNVEIGRKGHVPPDTAEINGGPYTEGCSEASKPIYNTPTKSWTTGQELVAPEEDTSLAAYVEPGYEFEGATTIELEGKEMTVTNANYNSGKSKKIKLPPNGLVYVRSMTSPACNYGYEQESNTDTATSIKEEIPCGTIYVKGKYSESLTLGAEKDVVIKGNIWPESIGSLPASGSTPKTPSGTVTLGLIATNFVRIFHACTGKTEEGLKNPWIFAAILSTSHSFVVDNYGCGNALGELNVFGAIAQNFRGIVGTGGGFGGGTGYLKNYNYDDRLATNEPPYFLAPLKAGWRIVRETAPTAG
jgi:hypothetical protein